MVVAWRVCQSGQAQLSRTLAGEEGWGRAQGREAGAQGPLEVRVAMIWMRHG